MTITFEENGVTTPWVLSAEEERLLEALRQRLLVEEQDLENPRQKVSRLRFDSIAELIHTHILDSLALDQIRLEAQQQVAAAFNSAVTEKRAQLPPLGKKKVSKSEPVILASAEPTPAPETPENPSVINRIRSLFS